jgi:hypothetical protein
MHKPRYGYWLTCNECGKDKWHMSFADEDTNLTEEGWWVLDGEMFCGKCQKKENVQKEMDLIIKFDKDMREMKI